MPPRASFGLLLGLVGGGALLDAGKRWGWLLVAFAILFAFAGSARLASAFFLSRQSEQRGAALADREIGVVAWLARFKRGRDGRLLLYLLATQTAVYTLDGKPARGEWSLPGRIINLFCIF